MYPQLAFFLDNLMGLPPIAHDRAIEWSEYRLRPGNLCHLAVIAGVPARILLGVALLALP